MRVDRCALVVAVVMVVFGVFGGSAAAAPGVGWELTGRSYPTNFAPTATGTIVVDVLNIGAAGSAAGATFTDVLPKGVTALQAGELKNLNNGLNPAISDGLWACTGNGSGPAPDGAPGIVGASVITCTNTVGVLGGGGFQSLGVAGAQPEIGIEVASGSEPGSGMNRAAIVGGGAVSSASTSDPVLISSEPPVGFAVSGWDGWFSNADGTIDTQAGSHPYEASFSIDLATYFDEEVSELHPVGGELRTVETFLPPGFVGDPTAAARCTRQQLLQETCPDGSQIGVVDSQVGFAHVHFQLYNMVPPEGVPAEFGFNFTGVITLADSTVRSGSDYGLNTDFNNVPQKIVLSSLVTVWGVPNDPSHDEWRTKGDGGCGGGCSLGNHRDLKPFLTLPTACGERQPFTARVNSWEHPNTWVQQTFFSHDSNHQPTGFTGCENEAFGPTFTISPDTSDGDSPAGLTVEVKPPVGGLESPEGLSSSDIQDTTVKLPAGLVINPGQAAGLKACRPGEAHVADGQDDAPECPLASKVGTDEIETPLLPHAVRGNVYVLQSDPPNLELLVAASGEGVNLKLVGQVTLCETAGQLVRGQSCDAPGQLISTFANTPELPFTSFRLAFSGGAQAALATPTACESYTALGDFTPWGSPLIADVNQTASFAITAGPGGSPAECTSPLPFTPTLTAGATSDQAGGFTNFSMLLQRADGQQRIEKLAFKAPAGLSALISQIPLCDDAHANAGTCPAVSQIGHATVTSGPGRYPLVLPQPGEPELPIYLTGPYHGAPFGLSIVTPVLAGPFDLGTIVTRARIEVDPRTAQITVLTDPLPQIVRGVPTDLRSIDAVIDRPSFMFNPTNCTPTAFTGTATSAAGGASAPLSSPFQVGSCPSLGFKPKVTVSTAGRASKQNGASLSFDISYPKGAMGREAWFNEAKFSIPKQLPARLTTIQQACLAATFEHNRSACPAHSVIGHAVVHTPVLPVPLEGPVYFVSYGGAAFPDAVLVLDGENVHIELHGNTFINNRTGVTSATFKATPDVPFENIEVSIPTGPYSEFGANLPHGSYSFCGRKLVMPTFFKAQNGLEIHQNTPVHATGCPKAKKHHKAGKATRHRGRGRKK
jgi:hypothetical protein